MSLKPSGQLSLADLSANKRKCKHTFFEQINKLVDWEQVHKLLRKYYPKGLRLAGRQAYDPLLLFKMLLLQNWYGLSDCTPVQV
jgi:IS5 family transposase